MENGEIHEAREEFEHLIHNYKEHSDFTGE